MNRAVLGVVPVVFSLLAVPALAQDAPTYDLRQEYKHVAGDKLRVHERTETRAKYALRAGAQTMQEVDQTEGFEQRYDEEVQEVDAEGDVIRSVRTYTLVHDLATSEKLDLQASPIQVQMARDEDGTFRFTAVDATAQVPDLLERLLDQEAGRKETQSDEEGAQKLIMPEGPVAVGATWPITLAHACEVFKFEERTLGPGAEARGTLTAAEAQGDQTMLKVDFVFNMPMTEFNGMACPEPMKFDATISLRLPANASGPQGGATMSGTIKGKAKLPEDEGLPPDAVLDLDMKVTNTKTVERLPAK